MRSQFHVHTTHGGAGSCSKPHVMNIVVAKQHFWMRLTASRLVSTHGMPIVLHHDRNSEGVQGLASQRLSAAKGWRSVARPTAEHTHTDAPWNANLDFQHQSNNRTGQPKPQTAQIVPQPLAKRGDMLTLIQSLAKLGDVVTIPAPHCSSCCWQLSRATCNEHRCCQATRLDVADRLQACI